METVGELGEETAEVGAGALDLGCGVARESGEHGDGLAERGDVADRVEPARGRLLGGRRDVLDRRAEALPEQGGLRVPRGGVRLDRAAEGAATIRQWAPSRRAGSAPVFAMWRTVRGLFPRSAAACLIVSSTWGPYARRSPQPKPRPSAAAMTAGRRPRCRDAANDGHPCPSSGGERRDPASGGC